MNEGGDSAPALQALRPSRADEQGLSLPYSPSSATLPPPSGSLTGCVWNVMAAMMEQLQRAVEPVLESTFTKRRRQDFLASAGPTLLCLTFVEDALRVLMRWSEQMQFMTKTMKRCERPARRTYADVGLCEPRTLFLTCTCGRSLRCAGGGSLPFCSCSSPCSPSLRGV